MTTITPRYSVINFRVECDDLGVNLTTPVPGTDATAIGVSIPWPAWIRNLDDEPTMDQYESIVDVTVSLLMEELDRMDLTVTRRPSTFREFRDAVKNAIVPGGGHVPVEFRAYRPIGDFREIGLTPRATQSGHPGAMVVTIDDDPSREGSREDVVPGIRVSIPGETVLLTWGETRMLRDALDEILGVAING